jgi:predicted nucleic acid-binding protein
MASAFLDTNVLLYANDADDPRRRDVALGLLAKLAGDGGGVISTQVFVEYASVALTKLGQPPADIDRQIEFFESSLQVVMVSATLVRRAVALTARKDLSYWDALIIAAAESAGCAEIYTEDLSAGQSYAGIRVVNPFTV